MKIVDMEWVGGRFGGRLDMVVLFRMEKTFNHLQTFLFVLDDHFDLYTSPSGPFYLRAVSTHSAYRYFLRFIIFLIPK